jgi:ABC-2 type transport system permease protein
MTLLAGLTTARETTAREGGTLWRAINPRTVIFARFIVLAGLSALFHALAFWVVVPLSFVAGAPADAARLLWAGLACWIATLGLLALAFVLTERWGTIPVFLAAWAWQVVGAAAAESTAWLALPPTWAVRAMLPILGAHHNAEPLAGGDPLASESPALALALSILLAGFVLSVRLMLPGTLRVERGAERGPVGYRSTREGALGAINVVMRSRAVRRLCAAAILLATATAAVYPNSYLLGLHTYAMLPLGGCVITVLTWQALAPGWRVLLLRKATVPAAVRNWLLLWVSFVSVAVTVIALANAARHGHGDAASLLAVAQSGVLWLILGAAGTLAALWMTVRFGAGWALGSVAILTIIGVTVGGDVLADTWLWILGPTAWPLSADTPQRFLVAALTGSAFAVLTALLSTRAMRNAPASAA